MSRPQQTAFASAPNLREENLQSHYKALNRHLAAAVLHARRPEPQAAPQMSLSRPDDDRDAEME